MSSTIWAEDKRSVESNPKNDSTSNYKNEQSKFVGPLMAVNETLGNNFNDAYDKKYLNIRQSMLLKIVY